jgi:uncharacterized protein
VFKPKFVMGEVHIEKAQAADLKLAKAA